MLLALLGLALLGAGSVEAQSTVHIGSVLDGPTDLAPLAAYRDEILALTAGELDVRFEPEHQLVADGTQAGVRAALGALLADPEVDLVVALGPVSSHLACAAGAPAKPLIAALVVDAELQGLPIDEGRSGVRNLNYVARPATFARDFDAFLDLVRFEKLAVLANAELVASIDGLDDRVRGLANARGLDYLYVPVGDSVEPALAAITGDVEAVYLTPLYQLPPGEWDRLVAGLNERRLPTFSYLGRGEVTRGVLAGLAIEEFPRLARRVALNVQRILLGTDAGEVPVTFPVREQLTLNMATARAIGVSPSWEHLVEAELLEEEDGSIERRVSLHSAVEEAIAANLNLLARAYGVAAGQEEPRLARAALLPRLEAGALALQIDEDRAAALFSPLPERSLTGSLLLRQILYVEPLLANLAIQQHLQAAREADFEVLSLDIALAASTAYLDLLRAKAVERIQRNNLQLTRSNLDLARLRLAIGTAGEAEVVRWQSQIARDRQAVVDSRVARELAEVVLNRLLHRPIEEPFLTEEVGLDDPGLVVSEKRFPLYTENPERYRLMRDFLVGEGLAAAPELVALDRLIVAQERQLRSARRSYWAPAVVLEAEAGERLAESGAGSGEAGLPPLPLPIELSAPDDSFWSLGLDASLPLFAGGERAAEVAQSEAELSELRATRSSAAEQIELRIRAGLLAAAGSFQGIGLSRASADAAQRNLELVTEAYAEGTLSILDLLDAQNSALVAERLAANAIYGFLVDLMEVQRAVNKFDFFLPGPARDAWLRRLEDHLRESGVDLREE